MTSAVEIARALGLRRLGSAYVGACPVCGYRGFQVQERDGKTLFRCHAGGCEQAAVLEALRKARLWGRGDFREMIRHPVKVAKAAKVDDAAATGRALKLWRRSQPAEGKPVDTYLRSRGLVGAIPQTLRFLPDAKHTETSTRWPAMIAAVTHCPQSHIVAVHRTFLRPDGTGKATVEPNRKFLGPVDGGAVRLAEAGPALAISEGIETALSVLAATGIPTWAALSAGGIRNLVLPPLPLASQITIAADYDAAGLAAANEAAERWHHEGRTVRIACPPDPGTDFNDLLRVDGLASLATLAGRAA